MFPLSKPLLSRSLVCASQRKRRATSSIKFRGGCSPQAMAYGWRAARSFSNSTFSLPAAPVRSSKEWVLNTFQLLHRGNTPPAFDGACFRTNSSWGQQFLWIRISFSIFISSFTYGSPGSQRRTQRCVAIHFWTIKFLSAMQGEFGQVPFRGNPPKWKRIISAKYRLFSYCLSCGLIVRI